MKAPRNIVKAVQIHALGAIAQHESNARTRKALGKAAYANVTMARRVAKAQREIEREAQQVAKESEEANDKALNDMIESLIPDKAGRKYVASLVERDYADLTEVEQLIVDAYWTAEADARANEALNTLGITGENVAFFEDLDSDETVMLPEAAQAFLRRMAKITSKIRPGNTDPLDGIVVVDENTVPALMEMAQRVKEETGIDADASTARFLADFDKIIEDAKPPTPQRKGGAKKGDS